MADVDNIADECIHLMTTAFCSICKANSRAAESRRRRTRSTNHPSWETEVTLPYPSTTATFESPCAHCDEQIRLDTHIYLVDGEWVCYPCAVDAATIEGKLSDG